jgi:hypothetical protein
LFLCFSKQLPIKHWCAAFRYNYTFSCQNLKNAFKAELCFFHVVGHRPWPCWWWLASHLAGPKCWWTCTLLSMYSTQSPGQTSPSLLFSPRDDCNYKKLSLQHSTYPLNLLPRTFIRSIMEYIWSIKYHHFLNVFFKNLLQNWKKSRQRKKEVRLRRRSLSTSKLFLSMGWASSATKSRNWSHMCRRMYFLSLRRSMSWR